MSQQTVWLLFLPSGLVTLCKQVLLSLTSAIPPLQSSARCLHKHHVSSVPSRSVSNKPFVQESSVRKRLVSADLENI